MKTKKFSKFLSLLLALLLVVGMMPVTAMAASASVDNATALQTALTNAVDGDTITLTGDITGGVSYTGLPGKTVTIDGGTHKITAAVGGLSTALTLWGDGTVILKNITLQGNTGIGSFGLYIKEGSTINVQSAGTVSAFGGDNAGNDSFGLYHHGSGTVRISSAQGGSGSGSCGIRNHGTGTVYADTATGGTADSSIGVDNVVTGTVNVGTATGGEATAAYMVSYGVYNRGGGVVNAARAVGGSASGNGAWSYGVKNVGTGTVNVGTATGGAANASYGVFNNIGGTVNANAASGGSDAMNVDKSWGVYNNAGGTINVTTAAGGIATTCSYGAENCSGASGSINVKTATSSANALSDQKDTLGDNVHSGSSVTTLNLNKGAGASCVLDSITVAKTGTTTIGSLPTVSKNGVAGAWYTDEDLTTPFSGTTVNGLTALYSSFYATPVIAPTITSDFTDANFLAAVRVALGKGSTDPIYDTDVASVTSLHVSFKNIASLAGLEHLTELTELYCAYNPLTALDVSKNIELIELGCTGNQLTALDVSKNTKLTKLECVYNQLKALDVSKNTALTMLDCSYNYMPNEAAITGLNKTLTTTFNFEPQSTPSGIAPTITSDNHTTVAAGTGSTFQVTATGTGTMVYSLSGTVPSGVSIDASTGLMTIGAMDINGFNSFNYTFTVNAGNGIDPAAAQNFTLTVISKPVIRLPGFNNGTVGVSYEVQLPVSGAAPISWSVVSGSLPAGLSLSAVGLISGTPIAAGTSTFSIKAQNSVGMDIQQYSMTVQAAVSSNHNTGGGGGGSSTATTTTTPTTTVSESTATATVTPTVSGGTATVSVSASQMNDALKKAQTAAGTNGTPNVTIQVSGASGASSVSTTVPHASMQALVSGGVGALTISGPTGSVSFDADALSTISGASDAVTVSVAKVDSSTLSAAAQALVGRHPVFTFSVNSGGSTISQFGGDVTVSVPYTPASGEDTNAIVIYYVDAYGTPTLMPDARYDAATGKVVFNTTHFSTYAVGYNKVSFNDVSATAWYADAVTFLSVRGVTSGTTASTFSPAATLTRGQFVTMLLRAHNVSAVTNPTDNFTDAGSTYYTGYLAAAKKLGITSGVGDNKFAPNQAINRQEMFTLLYNALKVFDKLPEGTSGKTLSDFSDSGKLATWASDAMTVLVKAGTVTGSNGTLNPTGATTRAEMAQVLYNLLGK